MPTPTLAYKHIYICIFLVWGEQERSCSTFWNKRLLHVQCFAHESPQTQDTITNQNTWTSVIDWSNVVSHVAILRKSRVVRESVFFVVARRMNVHVFFSSGHTKLHLMWDYKKGGFAESVKITPKQVQLAMLFLSVSVCVCVRYFVLCATTGGIINTH